MILGSESEKDKDERKSVAKRTHDDGLLWWWLRFEVFISGSAIMANYFFYCQPCMGGSYYNVLFSFLLRVRISVERRGMTKRKHGKN